MRCLRSTGWLAATVLLASIARADASACVDPALPDHRSFTDAALQALNAPDTAGNLVVGDSIAERWPAADIAHWMGGPAQNLGVSGDTPHGLLWRLGQIRGERPWRRILLIVGINGAGSEPTCHDVAASIEADVDALHRLAPGAKIVVLAVMPLGPGLMSYLDRIRAIDAVLARDAGGKGFTLVDTTDTLLSVCGNKPSCPLLLPDWLHPTPAGYDRIGPSVQAAFEAVLPGGTMPR